MSEPTEVAEDRFAPVAFDPQAYAVERSKHDPAFRAAFEAADDEHAAIGRPGAPPQVADQQGDGTTHPRESQQPRGA